MTIESTFLYLQDLNNETLAHLDAENRRQTLEEEMEFMKKVHEQVNRDMLNRQLKQENKLPWYRRKPTWDIQKLPWGIQKLKWYIEL